MTRKKKDPVEITGDVLTVITKLVGLIILILKLKGLK